MGYTYLLTLEEDLDALGVPSPDGAQLDASWRAQGGDGPVPPQLQAHVAHAWRTQWFSTHRATLLGEVDLTLRRAHEGVGWRRLLDHVDPLQRFYADSPKTWFASTEVLQALQARPSGLPEAVEQDAAALERILTVLARFGLRCRFDFCP